MAQNKTTKKSAGAPAPRVYEYDSLRRLDEALSLRSMAASTREAVVRKLGAQLIKALQKQIKQLEALIAAQIDEDEGVGRSQSLRRRILALLSAP